MSTIGQIFRLFLSSTFSDFEQERNALHTHVWPALRDYCRDRGARLQITDLRWGISEEAGQEQRTTAICLEEIRRCQDVSPDFSFLVLLGDRYGSRLLPESIFAPDFDRMLMVLPSEEQEVLQQWYRLDQNALPSGEYVLMPRGGPHAVAHGAFASFEAWQPVQGNLLAILTRACQRAEVSTETRLSILASVTEREIQAGIFDVPNGGAGALCFRRSIEPLPGEPLPPSLFESSLLGRERLEALGKRLETLPGAIIPFVARSRGDELLRDHLDSFCRLVTDQVKARIDQALTKRQESAVEVVQAAHRRFAKDRLRHFTGRTESLAAIAHYLDRPAKASLFISGPGGVGKTALMLRAVEEVEAHVAPGHAKTQVLYRFIGGSAGVSDLTALLRDLCTTLADHYGNNGQSLAATREDLIRQFPSFLGLATADRPLILFLDAVDQLGDAQEDLTWLSTTLPAHVHLVISAIGSAAVTTWLAAYPTIKSIDLAPLGPASLASLLTGLLADTNRTLQPEQQKWVLARCSASGLPLFLRLAAVEAGKWRSWQVGMHLPKLLDDIPSLLQGRFEELEAPAAHGQVLVEHALGLLGAAKDGLAEDELLDVLSQDDATREAIIQRTPHAPQVKQVPVVLWSRLYNDLEALLTEREQDGARLVGFYHRQAGAVVQARYLHDEQEHARHADLARYFEGQRVASEANTPNLRKLAEQPFQDARAHRWEQLYAVLMDGSFLERQIRRIGMAGTIADFALAPGNETLGQIAQALRAGAIELEQVPDMLWNEVQGRTGMGSFLQASLPRQVPRFDLCFPTLPPADASLRQIFAGQRGEIAACAFSPDGKTILSASSSFAGGNSLQIWDVTNGKAVHTFKGNMYEIVGCAFSPNGRQILGATKSRGLFLWDVATEQCIRIFKGIKRDISNEVAVHACVFSPDGRQVLAAYGDKTLRLWDIASGKMLRVFKGHTQEVTGCAFSPDGRQILSSSRDGTLRLWKVKKSRTRQVFKGHTGGVMGCAFSPDGQHILSASGDGTLRLWKVARRTTVQIFTGHTSQVNGCAFSPDGQQALSASFDGTLRLWEVASGTTVCVLTGHRGRILSCAFSPDGRQVLSGSMDQALRLWEPGRLESPRVSEGHTGVVFGCAFSPDGKQTTSASDDQTLRLWDVSTGKPVRILAGHTARVNACAFSPDGEVILSASLDGTLRLWEVSTGKLVHILEGHTSGVSACAFSPDGQLILSASTDQTLRLWDRANGNTLHILKAKGYGVHGCAFSPDGKLAISCGELASLYLWDVENGELLQKFERNNFDELGYIDLGTINGCAFSPDGRLVLSATGGLSGQLRLWNVDTRDILRLFEGHTEAVRCCAFSPDSKQAISASIDQTLRLWDVDSGVELARWTTDETLFCCAISPDGKMAIAGDRGGRFHFFSLIIEP